MDSRVCVGSGCVLSVCWMDHWMGSTHEESKAMMRTPLLANGLSGRWGGVKRPGKGWPPPSRIRWHLKAACIIKTGSWTATWRVAGMAWDFSSRVCHAGVWLAVAAVIVARAAVVARPKPSGVGWPLVVAAVDGSVWGFFVGCGCISGGYRRMLFPAVAMIAAKVLHKLGWVPAQVTGLEILRDLMLAMITIKVMPMVQGESRRE